ncbi:CheY-like chemotaxis protein [Paracidovorax wautersii]|uniref:CheY-like chemotaxis protein n=2 Tax=Paracidovorax wautersii TaxID=1177982 RepID=A0ABU1IB20_9BURK|nr:CheY-like chemotaxis protein [Paracidovorax wautersii]
MALEQEGYSIATVAGGAEALAYLDRNVPPVCMFIDYDMPGMNGMELAQAVRQRYGDDIVLIAITGSFDVERQRMQTFLDFVDHHFWKPVDWKRLMAVIASLRE